MTKMIKMTPQKRWEMKNGYISKTYKLHAHVVDRFSDTCKDNGVYQNNVLEKLMNEYCDKMDEK